MLAATALRAPRTPVPCPPRLPQDSNTLKAEQRELKAALKQSRQEVASLSARLDLATAELEAARQEASTAKRQVDAARSRSSLLEKAWASALWRLGAACEWGPAAEGRGCRCRLVLCTAAPAAAGLCCALLLLPASLACPRVSAGLPGPQPCPACYAAASLSCACLAVLHGGPAVSPVALSQH